MVKYIKEKGTDKLEKLTRNELFEYFVYNKLNKEKNISKNVDVDLIKRVLETLALTMEIYQTNRLTKDELMTFFRDIHNDLKINILSQITLDEFLDKSILKNNIDEFEFDNTEFQEFLAAKEISRFGKVSQAVFDLAVNKGLREIYPSWFNVLSYLVELNINLLDEIVDFGMSGEKTIVEGYFKLITDVNVNLLEDEVRNKIFYNVFLYHQNNRLSMDGRLCLNLSYYFTPDNSEILKSYVETDYGRDDYRQHILVRNTFYLVYYILERNFLSTDEINYWNTKLISLLVDTKINLNLKSQIMFLTKYLKDRKILDVLSNIATNADEDLLQTILNSTSDIEMNSEFTISLILRLLLKRHSMAFYEMLDISSLSILKSFFTEIIKDEVLLEKLHESSSSIYKDSALDTFIANVEKVIDTELKILLTDYIVRSYTSLHSHWAYHSKFLKRIVVMMSNLDKSFILDMIERLSKSENLHYFELPEIFINLLNLDTVEKFVETMREKFESKVAENLLFSTFYGFKFSNRADAKGLFELGKKYFLKDYEEAEKNADKRKKEEEKRVKKDYDGFSSLLETSDSKKYFLEIFVYYSIHNTLIEGNISDEERKKLIELTNKFLRDYNPASSGLEITETKNGTTSYTVNRNISYYGDAIITANLLGLDIQTYRQNIINYIPFAYSNHLQTIFELVGSISSEEAKPLIEIYQKKTDDLWRFMPENFLQVVEKFNLKEAEQIVFDFLKTKNIERISEHYKIHSLNILDSFKNDKKYIESIFKDFIETEDEKFIAMEANRLLIVKYQDKEAITWRIDQIVQKAFKFEHLKGAHSVGSDEHELTSKPFATPLMQVNDVTYLKVYLDLINKSYEIQKKDREYYSYAHYMREIVIAYFNNLRIYKKYDYLDELEKKSKEFENENEYGWFMDRIRSLKNQYLEYIGKPENVSDCIKKYNKIKSEQYNDINNSKDIFNLLLSLINNELNTWLIGEGSKMLNAIKEKNRAGEIELQKLLKLKLESILFEKGFRSNEIYIYREMQSLDDKRPDFLLGYGFIPPVLIELKLSDNPHLNKDDLTVEDSYKNLERYVDNFKVDFSIFLIYENQVREVDKWKEHLAKVRKIYSEIRGVEVVGIPK